MPSILLQVKDKNIRNLMRGMSANTAASKRNVALHKICNIAKSSELFSALTYLNQQGLTDHLLANETSKDLKELFSLPQITIQGANKEIIFQLSRVLHNTKKVRGFFQKLKICLLYTSDAADE